MGTKPHKIEDFVRNEDEFPINNESLSEISTKRELIDLLKTKDIRFENSLNTLSYEKELVQLQIELVKLQQWIKRNKKRVAIILKAGMLPVRVVLSEGL